MIIKIEKYGREIKSSKMSRMASQYELELLDFYYKLREDFTDKTLKEVTGYLTKNPLLGNNKRVLFYYYINALHSRVTVIFKVDEDKVTYKVLNDLEKTMEELTESFGTLNYNYSPAVFSNKNSKNSLLDKQELIGKEISTLKSLDIKQIPRDIIQSAQVILKPASMGADLKPIYNGVNPKEIEDKFSVVSNMLYAISTKRNICLYENIVDDDTIIDFLSKCSKHINIYYTRRKSLEKDCKENIKMTSDNYKLQSEGAVLQP